MSADDELDRITRFAAHLCEAPIATLSLIEPEKQRFLAREGIEESETARSTSFCARAMLGGDILEVLDATADERFAEFPNVTGGLKLRYYAGAPLITSEGAPLGALCVIDRTPRTQPLTDLQREGLQVLASSVMQRLEARRRRIHDAAALKDSELRIRLMADSIPAIAWSAAPGLKFDYFNARFHEMTGRNAPTVADDWREIIHPEDFEASLEKLSGALETATLFEDRWRLQMADGSYKWVLSRAVPSHADPETARWFGTITDIDEGYREGAALDLLARELAHRIKNVFSMISSLLTLRSRGKPEVAAFAGEMDQVIRSLAQAQDFVMPMISQEERDLKGLLELLLQPYSVAHPEAISLQGATTVLGPRSATPIALIIHELATNATKYGALSTPEGRVDIKLELADKTMSLHWTEIGGPPAKQPEREGFGTRLLKTTVENQLGGGLTRSWGHDGFSCTITVPADHLAE